jgi:hypothetical protein
LGHAIPGARKEAFLFEKKNQKTFTTWRACWGKSRASLEKVFWFFFSKKNAFFLSYSAARVICGGALLRTLRC